METDASLNEGRKFSKRRSGMVNEMNQQAKNMYNTMNERLRRQMFSYNPQNKISYLHHITMNHQHYTFGMYSNILYFAIKSLILLFIFHVLLCPSRRMFPF